MIETIYMEIIILLLLAYIIDKKIFPQIIIMFLTLAMLLHEISISTDIKSMIGTFVLFATVILYSSLQIALEGKDEV
jgi:hypothetical protein